MRAPRPLASAALVAAALLTGPSAPDAGAERAAATPAPVARQPQSWDDYNAPYDGKYHFVRVRFDTYGGGGGFRRFGRGREEPWHHDYPRAERNFMKILDELTYIGPLTDGSNILTTDDRELFEHPIAYIVEVGFWNPDEKEVAGLREYLLKGGFLIVDDFRGAWDLQNFELQIRRALPDAELVMLDESHDVFDSFFRIDPDAVIPPYGGQIPIYYGIFEENDRSRRLMVVVNFNNDLAEYWEFSDRGWYPIDLSNEAYKLGVNYIVYGMTH